MTEEILKKFDIVLDTLDDRLSENTNAIRDSIISEKKYAEKNSSTLLKILGVLESQLSLKEEEIERSARQERLQDVPERGSTPGNIFTSAFSLENRNTPLEGPLLDDELKEFITSTVGVITGLSVMGVASAVLRGGFRGAIGFLIGNFIEDSVSESLKNLGTDEEISNSIGEGLKKATIWAAIGSVFGRRFAVIAGVGGIFSQALEEIIDKNEDGIIEAFGKEWDASLVSGIGGILASVFGINLLKRGISSALFAGSAAGAGAVGRGKLKSSLLDKFTKGFKLNFGAAAILSFAGESLGSAITEATDNEDFGDSISKVAQFAAAGSMFGPKGALIGAIAGVAYTGANWLYKWFMDQNSKTDERLKKRVEEMSVDDLVEGAGDIAEGMVGGASSGSAYADIVGERLREAGYGDLISQAREQIDPISMNIPTVISEALYKKVDNALDTVDRLSEDGLTLEESNRTRSIIEKLQVGLAGINSLPESSSRNELADYYKDAVKEIVEEIDLTPNPIYDNTMFDMRLLREQYPNIPQGKRGGIFNMPETGGLSILHGKEAVIPLESNDGKAALVDAIQSGFSSMLAQKTDAISYESANMNSSPAPVVVRGGDSMTPVTNNNNNSSTTIINNTVDPTKKLNHIPT